MIQTMIQRCLMVTSFGAITVTFSEFWFYEVHSDVDSIAILLAYGILGYVFLIVLAWARVATFAALVVAMSCLGFLIEGVAVPVVYSGLPLTIVWTSLAWHMLLTLLVGWYFFKQIMTESSIGKAACFNTVIGIGLGLWNSYMWNAVEGPVGELSFVWQPTIDFVAQFLFGYGLFVGGHFIFERAYPKAANFRRVEVAILALVISALSLLTAIASGLWMFFPIAPLLVWLCLWALRRGRGAQGDIIGTLNRDLIPVWRYGLTALIPAFAITTYAVCATYTIQAEMNAYLILAAGPFSVWLFLSSLWKTAHQNKKTATPGRKG